MSGGKKFDASKIPLDLIPFEAMQGLGEVLGFGAKKYGRSNWAQGIEHSRLIAAAMRHLQQYNSGEDTDSESGLCHVAHAMCNLAFLIWMKEHRPDLDNRWIKQIKEENSND